MATISGGRRNAEVRSGGKMMKNRRASGARRTPYSRPEPSVVRDDSENPNWLSGLIYPARAIATGAGKIFATVFGSESSSSSDSDNEDLDSDDGDECVNDASAQGDDCLAKVLATMTTDSKRSIAHLVMQERFSREECGELTKLIESRVQDGEDGMPSNEFNRNFEIRSTAVMEAKRWLEVKKLGSDFKSKSEQYALDSNSSALPSAGEGEIGSPVDMAKSYMQDRLPWGSPSLRCVDFDSPSLMGIKNFSEETPKSFPGSSLQSVEKKMGSLATGSWNILEEIRRVRSKATDELLATMPSKKANLSSFSLENKLTQDLMMNDGAAEDTAAPGRTVHDKSKDSVPTTDSSCDFKLDEDGKAIQASEDNGGPSNNATHVSSQQFDESKSNGNETTLHNEVNGQNCAPAENGLPFSVTSISAEPAAGSDSRPGDEEMVINASLEDIPMEEKHEPQGVVSAEVPVLLVSDGVASGSQDSSSIRHEEQLLDKGHQKRKSNVVARTRRTPPGPKTRTSPGPKTRTSPGPKTRTSPALSTRGFNRRSRGRGK